LPSPLDLRAERRLATALAVCAAFAGTVALGQDAGKQPADFAQARAAANHILAQPEFRTVTDTSEIQQQIARFERWIFELMRGLFNIGGRSPWIATLLEWGFFSLVAAGLLAWGFRTMRRQSLAVLIGPLEAEAIWRAESENWAERARAEAAKQDWREAVHCLYWATIVMLEGRKLWRPNRARTPREYLRLVDPDSPKRTPLGKLTRIFERIWYGQRAAVESDYAGALACFQELSDGRRA
jgi:hypothetical protein